MNRQLVSFVLLISSFVVGLLTEQGPPISGGTENAGWLITLVVLSLLAFGVYGWYRIVNEARKFEAWRQREERLAQCALRITSDSNGLPLGHS